MGNNNNQKPLTAKQYVEMNFYFQYLINYLRIKKIEVRDTSFQINYWEVYVGRDTNGAAKFILEVNEVGMKITPLHKEWEKDFAWHVMHETLNFYLVY